MANPYNYIIDDTTGIYHFTTINGIPYQIIFVIDETFSTISGNEIPNIFQLIIEKSSSVIEPFDPNVSKTIESIVEEFFKRIENALIFICSNENNKAEIRFKVFERWYLHSSLSEKIIKIDNKIRVNIDENQVETLYTSFLFNKDNRNYNKLIDIFNQIEKVLNEEK